MTASEEVLFNLDPKQLLIGCLSQVDERSADVDIFVPNTRFFKIRAGLKTMKTTGSHFASKIVWNRSPQLLGISKKREH